MKYFFLICLFLCCLTGCNNKKNDSDNKKVIEVEFEKIIAGGFEPAWDLIIIHKNKNSYTYNINSLSELNGISGVLTLSKVTKKENTIKQLVFNGIDQNKNNLIITFSKESCINMAGDETKGSLKLIWKNNNFTGCVHTLIRK